MECSEYIDLVFLGDGVFFFFFTDYLGDLIFLLGNDLTECSDYISGDFDFYIDFLGDFALFFFGDFLFFEFITSFEYLDLLDSLSRSRLSLATASGW